MTPRVKLLTPFVGSKVPDYLPGFVSRVERNGIVNWEMVLQQNIDQFNLVVTDRLGAPCRKQDGYSFSDARPMLAEVYPDKVDGYEWWGWVETDVVLGDLDRLLPPLLDCFDAISFFPTAISGPMMLFRNRPDINGLFRQGDWRWVLSEPSYCNFEETAGAHVAGFHKDGGMTEILRESDLRVHWDDRCSQPWGTDGMGRSTPADCKMDGDVLFEVQTGRELVFYHFNHTKRWPLT